MVYLVFAVLVYKLFVFVDYKMRGGLVKTLHETGEDEVHEFIDENKASLFFMVMLKFVTFIGIIFMVNTLIMNSEQLICDLAVVGMFVTTDLVVRYSSLKSGGTLLHLPGSLTLLISNTLFCLYMLVMLIFVW